MLLSLTFLLYAIGYGQIAPNLKIKAYSLEEGLSHNLVTRIEKDSLGFVWLATRNGLNRFDGYEFLDFASGESSPFPISGDYIGELEPVEQGKFMVTYKGNLKNFDFFDPISFAVTPIYFKELVGETARILSIFAERNGLVYFLWQKGGLYFISAISVNGTVKMVHQIPKQQTNWGEKVELVKRKNGDFYLYTQTSGLFKISDKEFKAIAISSAYISFENSSELNFLKEDQQGRFWMSISKRNGIFLFDEKLEQFDYFKTPIGHKNIPRIWEDKQGNLIFGESLSLFHPSFIRFFLLDKNNNWTDVSYFTKLDQFIIDLESDDFLKTTLVGTVSGFKIAVNKSSTIKNMLTRGEETESNSKVIRGMTSLESGNVVITDEDGFWYELDITTDSLSIIPLVDKVTKVPINSTCTKQVYYDTTTNILWASVCGLGGNDSRFLKVNPKTWEAEQFYIDKRIESFCRKGADFWIVAGGRGTRSELFQFNLPSEKIIPFRTNEGINPLAEFTPNFIQTSKNGHLWLGTLTGLLAIDVVNKTIDSYDQTKGLSSNTMEAFLEIDAENALIGSNKGLDIYNFKSNTKRNINKNDGLSTNHIYSIIQGNEANTYWVGTILGLNFIDLNTNAIYNFFEKDGLSENEFNRFANFKDIHNRYYLGGVNGVNIFHQADLLKGEPAPKVRFTAIGFFNGDKNEIENKTTELSDLTNITLQPNDKYLELFFSLPDYSNPENNQYQVKLEGYDEEWIFLGNKNSIRYSTLPAGNYQFMVKGASSKGNWSEEQLTLNVQVLEAFHNTWQFWLLISLILGGMLQVFNEYQLKQKIKVERIRTKLSSDLHDEVSGLLSGIAMQSELLEMVTSDFKNKPKLNTITKISRSAMSRMSDVIWSIDSRNDKVEDLIARMSEHAMDILNPLDISWQLKVEKTNPKKKMPVLLRENLYFIYKEAINNIGKHANATSVTIQFGNENKVFRLVIHNNGQPKPLSDKSKKQGQGTANMKMRAEKIGATLTLSDAVGFTVKLTMPSFA